jgi:hypothetical protein
MQPAAMKLTKIVRQCRIDKPGHFKLADYDAASANRLRGRSLFRYKKTRSTGVNAEFTLIRELWTARKAVAMSFRSDVRAMTRGAVKAAAGAVLILGGFLLLSAP